MKTLIYIIFALTLVPSFAQEIVHPGQVLRRFEDGSYLRVSDYNFTEAQLMSNKGKVVENYHFFEHDNDVYRTNDYYHIISPEYVVTIAPSNFLLGRQRLLLLKKNGERIVSDKKLLPIIQFRSMSLLENDKLVMITGKNRELVSVELPGLLEVSRQRPEIDASWLKGTRQGVFLFNRRYIQFLDKQLAKATPVINLAPYLSNEFDGIRPESVIVHEDGSISARVAFQRLLKLHPDGRVEVADP